eukprot:59687_1
MLNKLRENDSINIFVKETVISKFLEKSQDLALSPELRVRFVTTFVWMVTALTLRAHHLSRELGIKLVKLLSDENSEVALSAAKGFEVIMDDCAILLNKQCHATCSPLHRHRFFHHIPLTILTEHASVPADSRPYCLLAVARLAKHTPLAALRQKLETRLKLIFQAIRNFTISIVTACTFRCVVSRSDVQIQWRAPCFAACRASKIRIATVIQKKINDVIFRKKK